MLYGIEPLANELPKFLTTEFGFYEGKYCLLGDGCVGISSQLGKGIIGGKVISYKGFKTYSKTFNEQKSYESCYRNQYSSKAFH